MQEQRLVHRKYVIQILLAVKELFRSLPSLVRIDFGSNELEVLFLQAFVLLLPSFIPPWFQWSGAVFWCMFL
jgi:hypothetical protein